LARSRSMAPDLKTFSEDQADVQAAFTVKLNNYLDGCLTQIRAIPDAVAALRVLSDLQLVSFGDMKIMFPNADLHSLLGKLLDLGLLEAPSDSLYRVPRLVVRRLDTRLDVKSAPSSDSLVVHDRFKRLLDNRLVAGTKEPLIDRIEARVRAALLTGTSAVDSHVAKFITASYLLQAGIRAYDKQDYEGALRLLRDGVRHRNEFPEINTRCVMLRYFGLAAAREDKTADTQLAVDLLLKEGQSDAWRKSRVNPLADAEFVRGFVCRLNERWSDACRHYLISLKRMKEDGGSRLGDCHREIAECYLHEHEPNYREARFHALRAYESRDTIMALDIVVKALTASFWRDESLSARERDELEVKLNHHLDKLQELSTSLRMGMWHQRKAEDLMQSGEFADLEQALAYAKEALAISSRQDFYPLIWKLLIRLQTDAHLNELIRLTTDAIANHRFNGRTRSVAARYLVGAHIQLGDSNNAQRSFDHHRSGFPHGVAATIQASIRARDISDAGWL
jgi:tetratricopeptide (TPR) repeat protein